VLVDGGTASASEVLASCLRDWRSEDITLVGTRTYGKGRGQYLIGYDSDTDEYFLADGGVARMTFSILRPVLGVPYDSIGMVPDRSIAAGEDALDVALAVIAGSVPKYSQAAAARSARVARLALLTGQLRPACTEPLLIGDPVPSRR
jgi:C-terminal processing protease CtpA/Prc